MKIVGLAILFVITAAFSEPTFARATCKGKIITKIDDGSFGLEQVHFVPSSSFQKKLTSTSSKVNFDFERKSDEWIYYSYVKPEDRIFLRQDQQNDFSYRDIGLNKESFFKFKDQSIVGYKLLCRM